MLLSLCKLSDWANDAATNLGQMWSPSLQLHWDCLCADAECWRSKHRDWEGMTQANSDVDLALSNECKGKKAEMGRYFCLLFCLLKVLLVFATFKTKVKFKIKIWIFEECKNISLSMQQAHSSIKFTWNFIMILAELKRCRWIKLLCF